MAKLAEFGKQFPCVTEGVNIPIDDELAEIYSGEVMELWYTSDNDIGTVEAFLVLHEVLRMKEKYPYFVLHYIKVETRKITVQYSIAPVGATGSGLIVGLCVLLAIAIGGLIAIIGFTIRWTRGYLWSPIGSAVITAKHTETQKGIAGVRISVDGKYVGKTDGGSVSAKGLLVGDHQFSGETKPGYHPPAPVTAPIALNQVANITIWYRPIDIPEPTTGDLVIYTSPVKGEVYVDGVKKGLAPITIEGLSIGNHSVGFGPVEDYITPSTLTVTIIAGIATTVTGYYKLPEEEEEWYEKYLKGALVVGGSILGAVLILPPAIRALKAKTVKQE